MSRALFAWFVARHAVVAGVLCLFASSAFAAPPIDGWQRSGMSIIVRSAGEACNYQNNNVGTPYTAYGAFPTHCQYSRETTGDLYYAPLFRLPNAICPDGSAPNTTKPLAEQCGEPNTCSDKNPFVRKFLFQNGPTSHPLPTSVGGCDVTIIKVLVCRTETISNIKSTYCMIEMVRTGSPTSSPENPASPQPQIGPENPDDPKVESPPVTPTGGQCPEGTSQVGASASGTPICVGGGTSPGAPGTTAPTTTTSPPVTVTNPDGSTTTTETVTKANADGSKTTTTTTTKTAVDGTKTVSQVGSTSANAAGGAGVEENPDDKNFCKQNPMLNVCKNSTVNGTCGEITCNGDAIACATLRAAAASECRSKAMEDELKQSSLTTLGNAAIGGNDPMKSEFPTVANGQVIQGPSSLDSSGWLGGGACFADKSFALLGRTIVLPLSQVCPYLVGLRYALMVVASIFSFKILSGAILNR